MASNPLYDGGVISLLCGKKKQISNIIVNHFFISISINSACQKKCVQTDIFQDKKSICAKHTKYLVGSGKHCDLRTLLNELNDCNIL